MNKSILRRMLIGNGIGNDGGDRPVSGSHVSFERDTHCTQSIGSFMNRIEEIPETHWDIRKALIMKRLRNDIRCAVERSFIMSSPCFKSIHA